MKIDVIQTISERKNEFEIQCNNILKYKAVLPYIDISDPLNIEKIREIKIFDLNNNLIYNTNYNYVENLTESIIPMKYLVTGSQKFNQLVFNSKTNSIKIYYEMNDIWKNRYVIDISNKKYFIYSIEDGYTRHLPIYDGETQIGEILKSNVVIDAKDEYCCYLKEENNLLADGIIALILYLDRSEYSSCYLVNKSYSLHKAYSYNKTNKYYDSNWVTNNFGNEYYQKLDETIKLVKEKLQHPLKTQTEDWNKMSKSDKLILKFVLIGPWAIIFFVLLIIFIIKLIRVL